MGERAVVLHVPQGFKAARAAMEKVHREQNYCTLHTDLGNKIVISKDLACKQYCLWSINSHALEMPKIDRIMIFLPLSDYDIPAGYQFSRTRKTGFIRIQTEIFASKSVPYLSQELKNVCSGNVDYFRSHNLAKNASISQLKIVTNRY